MKKKKPHDINSSLYLDLLKYSANVYQCLVLICLNLNHPTAVVLNLNFWPFNNTVFHILVTPKHKITLLLINNFNFATVMNYDINM